MLQHSLAVVLLAKLHGREPHQCPYVTSEALRRRVVEVVGDIRHGEAGVLEQPRGANEPSHREILLGRGYAGAEKPAHERTWQDVEMLRERAYGGHLGRTREEHLEEAPAVPRRAGKVERELAKRLALHVVAADAEQIVAELAPSVRV